MEGAFERVKNLGCRSCRFFDHNATIFYEGHCEHPQRKEYVIRWAGDGIGCELKIQDGFLFQISNIEE